MLRPSYVLLIYQKFEYIEAECKNCEGASMDFVASRRSWFGGGSPGKVPHTVRDYRARSRRSPQPVPHALQNHGGPGP